MDAHPKPIVNLHKKLTNAISALTKAEKKQWEQLVSEAPTPYLFIFHFGTGCEEDYQTVQAYLEPFGQHKLQLFPVKNYAVAEFPSLEQTTTIMNQLIVWDENPKVRYVTLKYSNKDRCTMFFYAQSAQLSQELPTDIPNASYHVEIPGLVYIEDFITPEEEQIIMEQIDKQEWTKLNQRRIQHYGFDFIYGANTVETDKPASTPIPSFLDTTVTKVSSLFEGQQDPVDQLTVNEYQPGMGIPPHFDVHPPFKERFVAISLLSGVVMTFKSYMGVEKHLYLKPRSVAYFSGEVRYAWFHSIASRKMDKVEGDMKFRRRRVSLTFRTIQRDYKCQCNYPFFCESQGYDPVSMKNDNPILKKFLADKNIAPISKQKQLPLSSKVVPNKSEEEQQMIQKVENHLQDVPTDIEKKYVYEIYDKIAPHFSSTRYKPWPKIEAFLNELPAGSIVADVGCGNGKYLGVNPDLHMIGTDRSENLITCARERDAKYQLFTADSLRLPLRSDSFDACISIAVIHHFSNKFLRQAAIRELQRITKKDGLIMIYVWAMEQEEKQFNEQDVFVPWNLQFKYDDKQNQQVEETKEQDNVGVNDYQINEAKKTVVYKRYYHVFKKGEIEELIMEMPGLTIEKSAYDHANWVVILRKQ